MSAFVTPGSASVANEVVDEQPRDRWKRPLIHVPGKDKLVPYTRCTTFIDVIEDKSALAKWGKRMVLRGATLAPQVVREAVGLDHTDPAGKKQLDAKAEHLVNVAGANDKREKGSDTHLLSEFVDRGEPLPDVLQRPGRPPTPVTEQDRKDMAAYMMATLDLEVVHAERLVVVDEMEVAGTPDRVSYYDGPGPGAFMTDAEKAKGGPPGYFPDQIAGNLITDLKTGSVEYGALKMAMQLAMYSRGQFYDWKTQTRTPLPDVRPDWGLIVHLPAGSGVCTVYWIDLAIGWKGVQVAKIVRELRKNKKVMFPFDNVKV
ncbi:hypothetical protein [Micromonospora sp. NPDC049240]|uniref:hypothetical protein n=1 Tax=Micromonospora sp. NPDC049240 TaxID=3155151 RepID=UPI0033CD4AD3